MKTKLSYYLSRMEKHTKKLLRDPEARLLGQVHSGKSALISILVLTCFFLNCINPGPVQSKEERIQGYLERGGLYFQVGDYQSYVRAEAQYRRVIDLDPTNHEAYSQLGYIYYIFYENDLWRKDFGAAHRNWTKSHNCFNESLKYKPDYGSSYIGLAMLNFCVTRYDKARARLNQALLLPSADPLLKGKAYFWLGRCYVAQEKFPEALKVFEEYLKLLPGGPKAEDVRKAIREIERNISPKSEPSNRQPPK